MKWLSKLICHMESEIPYLLDYFSLLLNWKQSKTRFRIDIRTVYNTEMLRQEMYIIQLEYTALYRIAVLAILIGNVESFQLNLNYD